MERLEELWCETVLHTSVVCWEKPALAALKTGQGGATSWPSPRLARSTVAENGYLTGSDLVGFRKRILKIKTKLDRRHLASERRGRGSLLLITMNERGRAEEAVSFPLLFSSTTPPSLVRHSIKISSTISAVSQLLVHRQLQKRPMCAKKKD